MRQKILIGGLTAMVAGLLALPPAASADTGAAPTNLIFPSQGYGTTSSAQPVTVTVSCTFAVITCTTNGHFVPAPSFAGSNPGDFSQTNTCGASVSSPGTCTFNVFFTPTANGARTATLDVGDDDSSTGPPLFDNGTDPPIINLTGTGNGAPPPPPPGGGGGGTPPAGTPSAPTATSAGPTGLRAAALAKCKKKKGAARAKCKKKANLLPV